MRVTAVPAQVTTVEDRIIGNLGFLQILLLVVPLFVGAALYAFLPPFMEGALYKYVAIGLMALVCPALALRIRERVLILWLVIILRYNIRPRFYVYSKNVSTHRKDYPEIKVLPEESAEVTETPVFVPIKLSEPQIAKVLEVIESAPGKFRYETNKKGGLYVRLTEIED